MRYCPPIVVNEELRRKYNDDREAARVITQQVYYIYL